MRHPNRVVLFVGHPGTAAAPGLPQVDPKGMCTCPTVGEFFRDCTPDRSEYSVKVTDADHSRDLGGKTFPSVIELEIHFECSMLPPVGEPSFGARLIQACPNLEYLHIKGSADGSVIRAIAGYTPERPQKLRTLWVEVPLMLGAPNMQDHDYVDGLGFNALFYDRTKNIGEFQRKHFPETTLELGPVPETPGSPGSTRKGVVTVEPPGISNGEKTPIASAPPPLVDSLGVPPAYTERHPYPKG